MTRLNRNASKDIEGHEDLVDSTTIYNITDDQTAKAYEAYTKAETDALLDTGLSTKLNKDGSNGQAITLENLSIILANIDYVVESKVPTSSSLTWYRKYKSGWIEQGGYVSGGSTDYTVTFPKAFANTYYTVNVISLRGSAASSNYLQLKTGYTTTTMHIICSSTDSKTGMMWEARGMGA